MMRKQRNQVMYAAFRRRVLQGLAGIILATGIEGCAQSLSTMPSTATPTPAPRPVGSVLEMYRGHKDRVTTVAWSPTDSKYIASGSLDKTVQVWATNQSNHFQPFIYHGHTDGVQAVDWSPKGDRIASGSLDKTVQVWDALTGENIKVYQGHSDIVMTVAWSPDGQYIASGSADGTIRVWEVATSTQKYVYRGHTASVHSLDWSPDSQRIVSGSEDKTVQILDAATGKTILIYRGHSGTISSVAWSPDGKYIASGSWDKTVQVWNAENAAVLYTYRGYRAQEALKNPGKGVLPDLILALAWSHNGKRIAALTQVYCGDSCAVVLSWDAYTQDNFKFYLNVPAFAIAWSPDDTRLATSVVVSTQGPHLPGSDGPIVQIAQA